MGVRATSVTRTARSASGCSSRGRSTRSRSARGERFTEERGPDRLGERRASRRAWLPRLGRLDLRVGGAGRRRDAAITALCTGRSAAIVSPPTRARRRARGSRGRPGTCTRWRPGASPCSVTTRRPFESGGQRGGATAGRGAGHRPAQPVLEGMRGCSRSATGTRPLDAILRPGRHAWASAGRPALLHGARRSGRPRSSRTRGAIARPPEPLSSSCADTRDGARRGGDRRRSLARVGVWRAAARPTERGRSSGRGSARVRHGPARSRTRCVAELIALHGPVGGRAGVPRRTAARTRPRPSSLALPGPPRSPGGTGRGRSRARRLSGLERLGTGTRGIRRPRGGVGTGAAPSSTWRRRSPSAGPTRPSGDRGRGGRPRARRGPDRDRAAAFDPGELA